MNDTGCMSVTQRAGDVAKDAHAFSDGEMALRAHPGAERLAFNERHREVRQAISLAGCEKWNDVRLLQLCCELNLALESIGADTRRQIGRQDLDDHLSVEPVFRSEKHSRHAAATELAIDRVCRP